MFEELQEAAVSLVTLHRNPGFLRERFGYRSEDIFGLKSHRRRQLQAALEKLGFKFSQDPSEFHEVEENGDKTLSPIEGLQRAAVEFIQLNSIADWLWDGIGDVKEGVDDLQDDSLHTLQSALEEMGWKFVRGYGGFWETCHPVDGLKLTGN